ncbi:MAG: hypothetical protein EXR79_04215 [Myxococcales bacterium]|nr:hypothetical protein [Myxococcales bacterium]
MVTKTALATRRSDERFDKWAAWAAAAACSAVFALAGCAQPDAAGAGKADTSAETSNPGGGGDATRGKDVAGGAVAETTGGPCDPNLAGGPSPRGDVGGGFAAGRLAVLFGDDGPPLQCQSNPKATTDGWLLDPCVGWKKLVGDGPPPRARSASATDAVAGHVYVYGGRYRSAASSGTLCTGTAGCPVSETCSGSKCQVGTKYTVYGDLWRLDVKAETWTLLDEGKAPAPQPRSNTVLARHPQDSALWVMGGNLSGDGLAFAPMNDTWRYDVPTGVWAKQETKGPVPAARLFHSGVITADGTALIVVGGGGVGAFQGPFYRDAWRLDLANLTWSKLLAPAQQPMARIKAGLLAVPGQKRLLYFAGHDDGAVGNRNDLWWLDPVTGAWDVARIGDLGAGNDPDVPLKKANAFCDFPPDFTDVDLDSPERREAFLFDWDPKAQRAWLFGGKSDCGTLRDVWTLDPLKVQWTAIDDSTKGWSCVRYLKPCQTLCN